jgi:hypothetical protein
MALEALFMRLPSGASMQSNEKPHLVAPISAPSPQHSASSRTLLERLEAENKKLRAVMDELMLEIRALRDQPQVF